VLGIWRPPPRDGMIAEIAGDTKTPHHVTPSRIACSFAKIRSSAIFDFCLSGQNISILNVRTYNSDSLSIHRTLRASRCVLPSFQHSPALDILFLIFCGSDP